MDQAGPTEKEVERFQSKCTKVGDCLIWNGYKDRDGYGQITFRRLPRRAHRVALWLIGRTIPDGFVVNHTCRHRDCVNPQHLNVISPTENSKRDSASMGYINSQKTQCPRGHEYDRVYKGHRYCSRCESEKTKRLRKKWRAAGILKI